MHQHYGFGKSGNQKEGNEGNCQNLDTERTMSFLNREGPYHDLRTSYKRNSAQGASAGHENMLSC